MKKTKGTILREYYNEAKRRRIALTQEEFAKAIGYSKSQLVRFLNDEEDISNEILALAESVANGTENVPNETFQQKLLNKKNGREKKRIPFYDTEATATDTLTDMTPIHAPAGTIDIGDLLNDSQSAIRIYGNSMLPNYPPGCVAGLIQCSDSYIEPGEVYVVETRDRRILKRLFYKEDDTSSDLFTCYSDNIMKFTGGARDGKLAYPPFDLPKKEIKKIFMVTGVIKRNSNSVIINRQ